MQLIQIYTSVTKESWPFVYNSQNAWLQRDSFEEGTVS